MTLRCEKQQVGALGEHLDRILASLPPGPAGGSAIPAELIEPVEPAWIVGALALGFDEEADRLIIQVAELTEEDAEPGATARWEVRRDQARAFIARAHARCCRAAGPRARCAAGRSTPRATPASRPTATFPVEPRRFSGTASPDVT